MTTPTWTTRAACLGHDGDTWFPVSYESAAGRQQTARAIDICNQCPVRNECLDDVLADEGGKRLEVRHGIRGGTTPQDRYNHYRRSVRSTGVAA